MIATFAEQRLAVFESWGLTRGQFWPLLGAYALALACIAVIGFLILVVFSGVAGAVVLANGGRVSDVANMLNPQDGSLHRPYFAIRPDRLHDRQQRCFGLRSTTP